MVGDEEGDFDAEYNSTADSFFGNGKISLIEVKVI